MLVTGNGPPVPPSEESLDQVGIVALPHEEPVGRGELFGGEDVEAVTVVDPPEQIPVHLDPISLNQGVLSWLLLRLSSPNTK